MPKSLPAEVSRPPRARATLLLLGPAFVAAIAYVDPGNVAANLTAGARYGYLLLWVLILANAIAVLVQYQSAKLGIVTGQSLPEILGERLKTGPRRVYWIQAELVAAATDIAEVLGGAIALYLLFGIPLLAGGVIVGIASMVLLAIQSRRGQRSFEIIIVTLLGVIVVGFMSGLFFSGLDPAEAATGIIPRFEGVDSVLLATSMLGATVMPHVIYLHSALARDRHGVTTDAGRIRQLLRATRWDVGAALLVAGAVNISMLLLAASALRGIEGTDTIEGAHAAVVATLGPAVGVIFAVGLLASGLASTSVGTYAGSAIMGGLLKVRVPLLLRRAITLIPALVILAIGFDPTQALVLSQVVLSFGIPFALIPLVWLASSKRELGEFANAAWLRWAGWISAGLISVLNVLLIVLVLMGVEVPAATAIEDYVKVIYGYTEWQPQPITTTVLAARLGLANSSVTEMVKKLVAQGLVSHEPYGAIELTTEGSALALRMVRRHRLIETWLVQEVGYSWDEVHDEAEVLEHAMSDRLLDALDDQLGNPVRDPHGDPIPTRDGTVRRPDAVLLADLAEGSTASVARISDRDPTVLRHLEAEGIRLDTVLEVVAIGPRGGTVAMGADRCELAPETLASIWVESLG